MNDQKKLKQKRIRVFLADDHLILREGIRALLQTVPDIEIAGEAGNGQEAIEGVRQTAPDVVLMDITMPVVNGLEATRQIIQQNPDVKVLILTVHESNQYLAQMLRAGASGYIVKTATGNNLIAAIKSVYRGAVYLYPSIARLLVEDYVKMAETTGEPSYEGLTAREREILKHIAEDRKNKEIADLLGISVRTVQVHRTNLMDKLGAHDRTELVKFAIRKGLIDL